MIAILTDLLLIFVIMKHARGMSKIQYLTKLAEPTKTKVFEIIRMLEVVLSQSDSNFILENGGILLLKWTPWKLLNGISHLVRTYGNNAD